MKKIRVLVFPCGAENGLEVYHSLRHSLHAEVYGASSADDHGRFRFDRYIGGLPYIGDPAFDDCFGRMVAEHAIDLVFGTHDSVMEYLAPRAGVMGFHLVNGNAETARIARRKSLTYRHFRDCAWTPVVYGHPGEVSTWPVVVKPDLGQGGVGVAVAGERDALDAAWSSVKEPVIVEHLPGDECTVDCFSDAGRELVWVGPRTRERVRAGISMRSRVFPASDEIRTIAEEINRRLILRGPWFFQLKADAAGRYKLLEVSCRVAGTMVAQRARGVNLPLMAIHDYMGRKVEALPNGEIDMVERSIVTRAALPGRHEEVCVDLDDTLVIDGNAVPAVVAFLYQEAAAGRRIKLITRHDRDVLQTLARARIAAELFDEIIHLRAGEAKSDYVTDRSIFIDNHYPERAEVRQRRAVPVLDVDAVEFFLR